MERPCYCNNVPAAGGAYVNGQHCLRCYLYHFDPRYKALWGGGPAGGPGTELTKLLASLGITYSEGCACKARAGQMDAWGPDGCEANRATILGWLREEYDKRGWLGRLKAAAHALAQGLVFDPRGPLPGILDEAIRRARAK